MTNLDTGWEVVPDIVMSPLSSTLSPHVLNRPTILPASPHPQSLDVNLEDPSPLSPSYSVSSVSSVSLVSFSSTSTSDTMVGHRRRPPLIIVIQAAKDIKYENQGQTQQPMAFNSHNSQGFGLSDAQSYEKSIDRVRYYVTYPTEGMLLMMSRVVCPCCLSAEEYLRLGDNLRNVPCVKLSLKQNNYPRLEFEKHLPVQSMDLEEIGKGEKASFLYFPTSNPNKLTSVSGIKMPWSQLRKDLNREGMALAHWSTYLNPCYNPAGGYGPQLFAIFQLSAASDRHVYYHDKNLWHVYESAILNR